MLHNGFNNVFHLEGGIINYAKEAEANNLKNKFAGKNFVFDNRLGERVTKDIISKCHQCGQPCDTHTNCRNDSCHLLFIQCEECAKKHNGCCTTECQTMYNLPPEQQKILREGKQNGIMIFNKSRQRLRPRLTEKLSDAPDFLKLFSSNI